MKEDWWEKPTCWICDYWWLLLIILALLLSLIFFFGRPLLNLVGLGQSINRQLMDRVSDLIDLERDSVPSLTTGDITFTLIWHTTDDLDLWVTDPSGETIYYHDPVSDSGGLLELDANAGCIEDVTSNPIEHIYWPTESAPIGNYVVEVQWYQRCTSSQEVPYTVILTVNGEISEFSGSLTNEKETDSVTTVDW